MSIFTRKAPGIILALMMDFGLDREGAAAIVGNLGYESGGFEHLQEIHPTSGRGGLGWAQWTGPRRVAFEAYCKRNHLDPKSDKANYAWLFVELTGTQKAAIAAVKAAAGLEAKVIAFERVFERAGVKNYPSRLAYAKEAFNLSAAVPAAEPPTEITPLPEEPQEIPVVGTVFNKAIVGLILPAILPALIDFIQNLIAGAGVSTQGGWVTMALTAILTALGVYAMPNKGTVYKS